jgi:hypothetical protein
LNKWRTRLCQWWWTIGFILGTERYFFLPEYYLLHTRYHVKLWHAWTVLDSLTELLAFEWNIYKL